MNLGKKIVAPPPPPKVEEWIKVPGKPFERSTTTGYLRTIG